MTFYPRKEYYSVLLLDAYVNVCIIQCLSLKSLKNIVFIVKNGTDIEPIQVRLALAPKWMDMDSNGILSIIFWLR